MKNNVLDATIRAATFEDLSTIITLLADDKLGKQRESSISGQDELPDCYVTAYHEIMNHKNQQLLVMELNSEIVGCLELTFIQSLTRNGGLRANVEGVRIKSESRGKGLGKQFFNYIKEISINKGCQIIQLTTDNDRSDAKKFYESIGFVASHTGMKMKL